MLKMHFRQVDLPAVPVDDLLKEGRIQKFKETGDWRYIYQSRLDRACFQSNMTHGDVKDLPRRAVSDKILC